MYTSNTMPAASVSAKCGNILAIGTSGYILVGLSFGDDVTWPMVRSRRSARRCTSATARGGWPWWRPRRWMGGRPWAHRWRGIAISWDNHLGTVAVEVDEGGNVVSYEEYHPYGTSAYRAEGAAIGVSRRRYRYTGKERDEETGLYYHGARYYAAWLGRWTAADPSGMVDGANLFAYVRGNPIRLSDPTGQIAYDAGGDPSEVHARTQQRVRHSAPAVEAKDEAADAELERTWDGLVAQYGAPDADSATGVKLESLGEGGGGATSQLEEGVEGLLTGAVEGVGFDTGPLIFDGGMILPSISGPAPKGSGTFEHFRAAGEMIAGTTAILVGGMLAGAGTVTTVGTGWTGVGAVGGSLVAVGGAALAGWGANMFTQGFQNAQTRGGGRSRANASTPAKKRPPPAKDNYRGRF